LLRTSLDRLALAHKYKRKLMSALHSTTKKPYNIKRYQKKPPRCLIWCSRCHVKLRSEPSKPSHPFDAWCLDCYTDAPLVEKSRRCSRGERKKLEQKFKTAAERLAKERAEKLAQKLARIEQLAANKKANAANRPKRQKGQVNEPFTLALEFKQELETTDNTPIELIETDYDLLRRRIAKTRDKTIFEQELEGEND
jgi:hypothetical protein